MKLIVFACALLAAPQEEDGTYFLSKFRKHYRNFNDVWGHATNDGREVAIVGTHDGTIFVETTDPFNPVELAYITHHGSNWSDMEYYNGFVYCVNETGGGLQIIDIQDLGNIFEVRKDTSWFHTAHNMRIDQGTGYLYACGANTGMPVIDINDPGNLFQTGNYTAAYVHDLHVQDGMAHLAEIYNGMYRIVDVTTPGQFPTLDAVITEQVFTHNAWASPDNTLGLTSDEKPDGHLGIWDISDPTDIQPITQFSTGGSATIHNTYMVGDLAHIAYYTEGYVCVDMSDPSRPCKLGQLDTYFGPDEGFDGVWGCYPFQPSGVIYINDRDQGLHVLTLATRIELQKAQDTEDELNPTVIQATLTAPAISDGVQSADLFYRVRPSETFQQVAMSPIGGSDWSGEIPAQVSGSVIEYYVEATDSIGSVREPRRPDHYELYTVGTRTTHYFTDFEADGDNGWTHGFLQTQDDWQHGKPNGQVGDPAFAYSGEKVWGNDLGRDGWDGRYEPDVISWIASPTIDLTNSDNTRLRFQRWLSLDAEDSIQIVVNGTTVWETPAVDIQDEAWVPIDLDISIADGWPTSSVSFILETNSIDEFGGFHFDDFEIYSLDPCGMPQTYGYGTAGTDGMVPSIGSDGGAPIRGNDQFEITCTDLVGNALCGVFYGIADAEDTVDGLTFLVDLSQYFVVRFGKADGVQGVGGDGTLRQAAPIPNDPALVDVRAYVQVLALDDAGPAGFSASDGLTFRICDK